jgi:hypothetical protein
MKRQAREARPNRVANLDLHFTVFLGRMYSCFSYPFDQVFYILCFYVFSFSIIMLFFYLHEYFSGVLEPFSQDFSYWVVLVLYT